MGGERNGYRWLEGRGERGKPGRKVGFGRDGRADG